VDGRNFAKKVCRAQHAVPLHTRTLREGRPRWMAGMLPRKFAGHDVSCPYIPGPSARDGRGGWRECCQESLPGTMYRAPTYPDPLQGTTEVDGRNGAKKVCRAQHAVPLHTQTCRKGRPRWVAGTLPRKFAGHDVSCPYRFKTTARDGAARRRRCIRPRGWGGRRGTCPSFRCIRAKPDRQCRNLFRAARRRRPAR
jgi:hypothetical protein